MARKPAPKAKALDAGAPLAMLEAPAEAPARSLAAAPVAPNSTVTPEAAPRATPAPRGRPAARAMRSGAAKRPASSKRTPAVLPETALSVTGLTKTFGDAIAVDGIDLTVPAGSFFGFVGPNGAGKTTTLSMVTGLLRPDSGVIKIYGVDVWANAAVAKRQLGVLPDRLRLFDRLTGSEFLHHAGALRGLDRQTIVNRVGDLEAAFGIEHSTKRLVSDYSAGMVKKIGIAAAMIHSPRLLVLDEPFESVDPVSAQVVIDILKKFAAAGGTVVLSSHSMDLIERVCDAVAIIAEGHVLASGPMDEVLAGRSLEDRFVELAGGATAVEGMEWLQSFSD
ncbi:ATP-binding cassette domain-containing protein [Lysinimonas soli]|uniref:ATP-binding cassette domain-containing protein n=1 Tax=Lysinimonas soli TaxID=1074233 RepID=A0ABW0NM27_9MICO